MLDNNNGAQEVLVAQLGARMHYAVPRILHAAGMLGHFYTDICAVKGWPRIFRFMPRRLQPGALKRLVGRQPMEVPLTKITAFSALGLAYAISRMPRKSGEEMIRIELSYGKQFCRKIIAGGLPRQGATYTFNSAGLELMAEAKKRGLTTIMEQTIAPRRIEQDLLEETYKRYPEWDNREEWGPGLQELIKREAEEWQLADLILCGSAFVQEGIAGCGGPVDRCLVVPYGVDTRFSGGSLREKVCPHPLRVLTVGSLGSRKGLPDIIEAARIVGQSCLFRCVGAVSIPQRILGKLPINIELIGPVPRSEIFAHYRWADVFLLPSICEGSATVTYEALAMGLPVICTSNTGSIVENEVDGCIVPPFSPEDISRRLMQFANDRVLLEKYSEMARIKSHFGSLASYQERFVSAIKATIQTT